MVIEDSFFVLDLNDTFGNTHSLPIRLHLFLQVISTIRFNFLIPYIKIKLICERSSFNLSYNLIVMKVILLQKMNLIWTMCMYMHKNKSTDVYKTFVLIRDHHKHLLGGLMQKGALKNFEPLRGAWKKMTTNFPGTIEFIWFPMGLTNNFRVKRAKIFEVWKGDPKNFAIIYLFFFWLHQAPNKYLWMSLTAKFDKFVWQIS